MKRQFSKLFGAFAALMLVALVSSCGSKSVTPEQVAGKIESGQELTQADYQTMIDYVGEYAQKAQGYFNTINAQPNDSTADYVKASDDLANLYAKYPYLGTFRDCLANTDITTFDAANAELVNKYVDNTAFPLPIGEGAEMRNPAVQGMIEQMPNSDSSGVIADGVGEAVTD